MGGAAILQKIVLIFLMAFALCGATYQYTKISEPNLATYDIDGNLISGIHYDVLNSTMSSISILYCTWHSNDGSLAVFWDGELPDADKAILDVIVEAN